MDRRLGTKLRSPLLMAVISGMWTAASRQRIFLHNILNVQPIQTVPMGYWGGAAMMCVVSRAKEYRRCVNFSVRRAQRQNRVCMVVGRLTAASRPSSGHTSGEGRVVRSDVVVSGTYKYRIAVSCVSSKSSNVAKSDWISCCKL